ncbi:MAG: hypothetical protein ACKVT0_18935 [Planctomycetaceae bacterium]
MWCAGCKTDVAVEVSPDTERALCTACGRELYSSLGNAHSSGISHAEGRTPASFAPLDTVPPEPLPSKAAPPRTVADARQLLERWTRENLLDPAETKPAAATSEKNNPDTITRIVNEETILVAPKIAVDAPHETVKAANSSSLSEEVNATAAITRSAASKRIAKSVAAIDKAFADRTISLDDDPRLTTPSAAHAIAPNGEALPAPIATAASADEFVASTPEPGKSRFRIDRSHPGPGEQLPEFAPAAAHEPPLERQITASATDNRAASSFGESPVSTSHRQFHGAHSPLAGVHFDVQSLIQAGNESPRQSTQTIFGQMLAYLGVGVLTLGTGCVLWGYFGAAQYSHLAPTGWLITTAGQMLLFLGVVTLIAGGLEQTNSLVNTRLEHWERKWMEINGHIYRADPPTSQPMGQGPHIPVGALQPSGTIPRSATRTSADA